MIWLPSRSGRIASSSSCACSRAIRSSSSSYGPAASRGPALVAGGAVGAGQPVQPVQQRTGVADVAAHRGVGPLARRRTRGSAGAARPAARRRRSASLGNRSACSRLRVILAPTTSWWWKLDAAARLERARVRGLPMSCSSAASRSTRSGPGIGPSGRPPARSPARARSACARRRPCAGGARRSPAAAPAARAARARPGRCRPAAAGPAPGSARIDQLDQLVPDRSAETIADALGHLGHRRHAPRVPTANPSWATNRAARIIRSGSSANDSSRRARGAQHARPPGRPGRRTGRRTRGAGSRTAIALTVKSRRTQVVVERVAVRHLGLAASPVVGLVAVGGDLEPVARRAARADRAERDADVPDARRPSRPPGLGICSGGRRW